MRFSMMSIVAVLAAGAVATTAPRAHAQSVSININLGPPHVVEVYDAAYFGPWRTSYREWEPVTLYVVNGIYYEHPARGARVVVVYRRGHDYFLPPRDAAWVGFDRRFDYKHKPGKWDYDHGRKHDNGRGRGRGR
ncbi:MAG TPA: hypothetical protein VG916_01735 [Gemmatimonadaceae bacterium]|nr:hypothetical protein [Gemmatimonadaceae bacterium]